MPVTVEENIPLMNNNALNRENDSDNHGNNRTSNNDESLADAIHHTDVIAASSTRPVDNTDVGTSDNSIKNTNNDRHLANAIHENSDVSIGGNVRSSGLQVDEINRLKTDHPNRNGEVYNSDSNRNNRPVSIIGEHNRTKTEALKADTAVKNKNGHTNALQKQEQLQTDDDINIEVISDFSRNDNNKTRKLKERNCSRQTTALITLSVILGLTVMAIFLVKFVPFNTDGEWTTWGKWSPCTTSCQGGVQLRSRSCINPPPSGTGRLCPGDAVEIRICNNTCPYKFAAFSAGYPIAIKDGKLTFKTLIYQHGEDFDKDTGIFTCSIPGTYTFSVNLVKPQQNATLICHLYKNRSQMMNLVLEPSGGQGYSSVSSTVAAYLNVGDIVYLGGCSEPKDTIHWYSIFTGVLENHFN